MAEEPAPDQHQGQDAGDVALFLGHEADALVPVGSMDYRPPRGQVGHRGSGVLLDEAVPGLAPTLEPRNLDHYTP